MIHLPYLPPIRTPWWPISTTTPNRPGVYNVLVQSSQDYAFAAFSYWDGFTWHHCAMTAKIAHWFRTAPIGGTVLLFWRGLVTEGGK